MDKRIQTIVPETQQRISTSVERDGDELSVEVRACSALDDELRGDFHDEAEALGTESVSVQSRTDYSNQRNELAQDVTVTFSVENQLDAVDVIDNIVQLGKDYYSRQLERNLAREADDEGGSRWRFVNQQEYFDDEAVKEFCLLYRGRVEL